MAGIDLIGIAAIIGAGVAVAGTGITIAQQIQASKREVDLSEVVADQKEFEKKAILESAAADEQAERRRARLILSKYRAGAAASGIDPSYGTPLDQEIDFNKEAELGALRIRRIGALSASARDYEAAIARYRGSTAQSMLPYAIAGTALQGVGSLTNIAGTYVSSRRGSALSQLVEPI